VDGSKVIGSVGYTLLGTNISPEKSILKMILLIFLFPRWDMLIAWRVTPIYKPLPFISR